MQNSRIKQLRKMLELSQEAFAERLKISQSALSQIESAKKQPSYEVYMNICQEFKVSPNWLTLGIKPVFLKTIPQAAAGKLKDAPDKPGVVCLVRQEAHADYLQNIDNEDYVTALQCYTLPGFEKGVHRMFEIDGDSMEPTLYHGELVIAQKVEKPETIGGGYIYVLVTTSGIVVKRVFLYEDGYSAYSLKSDNKKYSTYHIQKKDLVEAWEVRSKITSNFLHSQKEDVRRFSDIEERMARLEKQLAALTKLGDTEKQGEN
jgi:transcriptional regulator with XRE-family HTH domain